MSDVNAEVANVENDSPDPHPVTPPSSSCVSENVNSEPRTLSIERRRRMRRRMCLLLVLLSALFFILLVVLLFVLISLLLYKNQLASTATGTANGADIILSPYGQCTEE